MDGHVVSKTGEGHRPAEQPVWPVLAGFLDESSLPPPSSECSQSLKDLHPESSLSLVCKPN